MKPQLIMTSPPGPQTSIDGIRYLYFGGTSYLGLARHPEVIEAGCRAMREYGVHSATTRAGFGTNPPVEEAEQRAAEFFGTEDAFYFSSGYASSHIMILALRRDADAICVEETAHYSAQEGARSADLPVACFPAHDPGALARAAGGHRRVLVVADAVGPATGRVAPVLDYMSVLESHEQATLLLDDAHGFGILGDSGRGLLDQLGLWGRANRVPTAPGIRLAVCGTLAKAFGGFGGIIVGANDFVERVRSSSHYFDGASAPPSAAAGSTAKALEIAARYPFLRERVRQNSVRLRDQLRKIGLAVPEGATAHFGVAVGSAENMRRIHAELKTRGILVPYLPAYAGVSAEGILRFAVFADHTESHLHQLVSALREVL